MQLFGSFTSPYVRHCRLVLAQTGLECEFVETDAVASAELSPTKKVPFLIDGALTLTDSVVILKYLREKAGQVFFSEMKDFELFAMVNTVMDATVNIFFLEKQDNIQVSDSQYLQRQQGRVESGLACLNQAALTDKLPLSDGQLRLACFLDWGVYRQRIDLTPYSALAALLTLAKTDPQFTATAPPENS
ncbi:glutathione S-transferase N-terminal domain-containing protein [Motilimonas cestriensis]|uniref:Glutathione S-transferase N-terminal domain-containing protein n=1 Tax=Motilimonas cestriensis TaxID=2742685 RepID=A0ABS8WAT7_9GAMM|nr:glutathione S-transferase N-terminal domain-containing protein [Motilimonas cestriensis]MCE2594861.1 glutathione S-transferase N-terminal domain-containing protein [Motilimonas cestriensis]